MRPDEISAATTFIANQSLTGNVERVAVMTPQGSHEGQLARVSLGASFSLAFVGPSGIPGMDDVVIDLKDATAIAVLLADRTKRTFGNDPKQQFLALQDRVGALYDAKRFTEALPVADEMVELARGPLAGSISYLAGALANRAELQRLLQLPLEAAASLREVVPLMQQAFGANHPNTRQTLRNLGNALADAAEFEEALVVFRDLLERTERAAPKTMEHASDLAGVAAIGARVGSAHFRESERMFRAAIANASGVDGAGLSVARWWRMLGDLNERAGWSDAKTCYAMAHARFSAELGPTHAVTLEVKALAD
ncbi:MAG: tetratricopeptide repeat protein [Archangiaceae bacterium]|nr:tetratricopeptide repeat protein [Archangiaceae bacterium]